MKTIGQKLKEARLLKELKQSDVAEKLNCAATSLTNWESGKVNPSLEVLSKLCEVYEISPLSLLEHPYSYSEITAIAGKPVSDRTYEEQVALNFCEPILDKLLAVEAQHRETQRIEETATFIQSTDLLNRFGGSMGRAEIEAVMTEYDRNNGADADIQFAYHALTKESKAAFLSMLSGLLSDISNLQTFNDRMGNAQAFTLEKLATERQKLKEGD
ncbi:MAG: helix-turn-helix transcriptional regulator [Succiniclasticum sp.]|nr:helix-turn-helix transcriptional regulator [Succiniclasticum sp.]